MAGLGSIAKITVSSANVAVVMSGEDGRSEEVQGTEEVK
jgi:hypothetical protein